MTRRDKLAAILCLLIKAPRTPRELCDLLGLQARNAQTSVTRWLRCLEAEGIARQVGERSNPAGRPAKVWEWCA